VCRNRWFNSDEMRDFIVAALEKSLDRTDTEVIAFVVMRNHFHLVLRQGYEPLEVIMSSFMRRVALRVRKNERHSGHVFEKRFWIRTCTSASDLRNAIVYVHRNPVKARLCHALHDYVWSSHNDFIGGGNASFLSKNGFEVFAEAPNQDPLLTRQHYVRYAEWRSKVLNMRKECPGEPLPPAPQTTGGDAYWKKCFTALAPKAQPSRPDLRDLVLRTTADMKLGLTLEDVRARNSSTPVVAVRKEVVRRAIDYGYAGVEIAAWLDISPQYVSKIKSQILRARYAPPLGKIAKGSKSG
jgi:REP element-mobilizing transposase RayT